MVEAHNILKHLSHGLVRAPSYTSSPKTQNTAMLSSSINKDVKRKKDKNI